MLPRAPRVLPTLLIAIGVVSLFAGADIFVTTWTERVAPAQTVTVCRSTGVPAHPYQASNIQIAPDGSLPPDLDPSRDVVPPYTYNGTNYPGTNWSGQGQAVWYAGCQPASKSLAVSQTSQAAPSTVLPLPQPASQLPLGLRPGPRLVQAAIRVAGAFVVFIGLAMIGVGRSSPRPVRPYLPVSSDLSMYLKPRPRPRRPRH